MRLILTVLIILIAGSIFAQKFQCGNYDVSVGFGVGFFTIATNDISEDADNFVDAATISLPLKATFSLTDRISAGLFLQNDRIIVDRDSGNVYGSLFHFGIVGQYRLLNKQNDALNINLCLGSSGLDWAYRRTNDKISGKGKFFMFGISYQHYWTNTLGYYFAADYTGIGIPEIKNKHDHIITVNYGAEPFYLELSGVHITSGLCLKF